MLYRPAYRLFNTGYGSVSQYHLNKLYRPEPFLIQSRSDDDQRQPALPVTPARWDLGRRLVLTTPRYSCCVVCGAGCRC